MTDESFRVYIDRMYPNFKESYKYNIKQNIAPCLVQKMIFDNKNDVSKVLEQVAVKNDIGADRFLSSSDKIDLEYYQ